MMIREDQQLGRVAIAPSAIDVGAFLRELGAFAVDVAALTDTGCVGASAISTAVYAKFVTLSPEVQRRFALGFPELMMCMEGSEPKSAPTDEALFAVALACRRVCQLVSRHGGWKNAQRHLRLELDANLTFAAKHRFVAAFPEVVAFAARGRAVL